MSLISKILEIKEEYPYLDIHIETGSSYDLHVTVSSNDYFKVRNHRYISKTELSVNVANDEIVKLILDKMVDEIEEKRKEALDDWTDN